jgi:hypothetical protein
MDIQAMRKRVALDLGSETQWSDDELDRAIHRAVDDLSLYYPRELAIDITVTLEVSGEEFTTDASPGKWVSLSRCPIQYGSERVTNSDGTISYTVNTDYEMDYFNGRIRHLSGGSMASNTTHKISYTLHQSAIDLSKAIKDASVTDLDGVEDVLRVARIEYPYGNYPADFIKASIWGSKLFITAQTQQGQNKLSSARHVVLYLHARQKPPRSNAPATYPDILDEIVIKGSIAYALDTLAMKHRLQSSADNSSARATLASMGSIHTEITNLSNRALVYHDLAKASLDQITTYINNSVSHLSSATTQATSMRSRLSAVAGALSDIKTEIDNSRIHLTGSTESATSSLSSVSGILTDIDAALANFTSTITDADTALDQVGALISGAITQLGSAESQLTTANGELTTAKDKLSTVEAQLTSAEAQLTNVSTVLSNLTTRLDNAITELDRIQPMLSGNTDSTKADLTNSASQLANAASAISNLNSEINSINGSADEAMNFLKNSSNAPMSRLGDAVTQLGSIPLNKVSTTQNDNRLSEALAALSNSVSTSISASLPSNSTKLSDANNYLSTGEGRINTVNIGDRVPELYQEYADAKLRIHQRAADHSRFYIDLANAYISSGAMIISEAAQRISGANVYVAVSQGYVSIYQVINGLLNTKQSASQIRVSEAAQRISLASQYVASGDVRVAAGRVLSDSGRARVEAASQLAPSANAHSNAASQYIADASTRVAGANMVIAAASARINSANTAITGASLRVTSANTRISEADTRINLSASYLAHTGRLIEKLSQVINVSSAYNSIAQTFAQRASVLAQLADTLVREVASWKQLIDAYLEAANLSLRQAEALSTEASIRSTQISHIISEMSARNNELQIYSVEAQTYQQSARIALELAANITERATAAKGEFIRSLENSTKYRRELSSVSPLQGV